MACNRLCPEMCGTERQCARHIMHNLPVHIASVHWQARCLDAHRLSAEPWLSWFFLYGSKALLSSRLDSAELFCWSVSSGEVCGTHSLYSRAHDGTAFSVCVCSPCAKPPERTPMNTESLRETLSPLLALFWFDSIRQVSFLRSHCSRPHFTAFLISFILFIAADRTLLFSRTSLDQRSSPFLIQIRFHPNSLFVRIPLFAHHPKLGPLPTATPKPQVDRTVCCS